jgi:hypothetical protein
MVSMELKMTSIDIDTKVHDLPSLPEMGQNLLDRPLVHICVHGDILDRRGCAKSDNNPLHGLWNSFTCAW